MSRILLFAIVLARAALSGADDAPNRYYGNVPFSLSPVDGPSFTAQHVLDDSNLVVLHFDFWGIPWEAFARDEPLPRAWTLSMDRIEEFRNELGLPVFLALTPISGRRDALAPNATGTDVLALDELISPPCERLSDRSDLSALRSAYNRYVDHMVRRFDPIYLAISIEVNLYAQNCPGAWEEMKVFLNAVHASQKARRPDLPVFNTFHIDTLWEADAAERCFGFTTDCLDSNLVAFEDLETDLFAISSYPLGPYHANGGKLPSNWITIFAERTGKRLAVAETGFQALSLTVENPGNPGECVVGLEASESAQRWYIERLLDDAETVDMPFVTWWGNHDYIPQRYAVPCRCDDDHPWCDFLNSSSETDRLIGRFFATIGLRAFDGAPRPALKLWQRAVEAAR